MSWRAITEADVIASMHSYEVEAYRTQALEAGQSSPFSALIDQVTLQVREAIRSCRDNVLSPTDSEVPEGTIAAAVAIVRHRLQTRFSDVAEIGEDRRLEYREAIRYLEQVRDCKVRVERYGDDEDDASPRLVPKVSARSRRFTRSDQEGI